MQECYIPEESRSIHHLNAKALRIVDLKTLDTQALLGPANLTLIFNEKRGGVQSVTIYRVENNFLCHDGEIYAQIFRFPGEEYG